MRPRVEAGARRLWVAYSFSEVGSALGAGALPLIAVLVLDAGPVAVATLAAVSGLAAALLAVPAGPWVEFRPKRPVMVTADLVRAVALLTVPVAAAADALTLTQLYVVGAVHGMGSILFPAASGAYLKGLVHARRRSYWLGRNEATFWTTQTLGPPLGGALISAFGATVTLITNAIGYLLSALTLGTLRRPEPEPPTRAAGDPWHREAVAGWRYILQSRVLAPLLWNSLVFGGGLMLGGPLMSIFFLRTLDLAPWQYGLALGVPCLGGFLGALAARRVARRIGDRRTLLWAGVARTWWTIPLAFAPPGTVGLVVVIVVESALLFAAGVFNPTFAAWRMLHTADSHMTRVLTSWSICSKTIQPLCMLVGGALAAATSIRTALLVSGLLVLSSTAFLPWRSPDQPGAGLD